jgi:hypothetical protein
MEAAQTAEIEAHGEPESEDAEPRQRCVISADGAMISLVHTQWAETRTVAIGEPQEKLNAEGEREIHVGKLSYFSRLADASTFTDLAEVEMQRRKVSGNRLNTFLTYVIHIRWTKKLALLSSVAYYKARESRCPDEGVC